MHIHVFTQLGAGTYAEVYQCTHRRSGKARAVKVVLLDRLTHEDDLRALEEEIEILSKLQVRDIRGFDSVDRYMFGGGIGL